MIPDPSITADRTRSLMPGYLQSSRVWRTGHGASGALKHKSPSHARCHCRQWPYRPLPVARPHWNKMARLSCNAKFTNPLQMYEWVICFEINCTWKQISDRVIFAYRWWLEISLIDENLLGIHASFPGYSKQSHSNCTSSHVNVRREICQDSQHQFHG